MQAELIEIQVHSEQRFRCATAMLKGQSGPSLPITAPVSKHFLHSLGKDIDKLPVSRVPTTHLART